jgi:hypothetical protein
MVNIFELTGNDIKGGTIIDFASTGIRDLATSQTVVVTDGKLTVASIAVNSIEGNVTVRGDMKVYGVLDAGFVRTTELITNQRYEKQYLEFASPTGETAGTGLLWIGSQNRQFVLKLNPDRFWLTEHVDIPATKSYLIDSSPVLSQNALGASVVSSSLQSVGTLKGLNTQGELNVDNHIFYSPTSQRVGFGTDSPNGLISILDYVNNVEIIIDSDSSNGYGRVGTFTTKGFELVTDNTPRISISETGNITLGQEYRDSTVTRVYGKMGIGVKNPREQFEVAGNMRMGNRLFSNGNAAPIEGTYQIGDIVWNSNPRANSYVGWICTSTGAPGSWSPFGLIAA